MSIELRVKNFKLLSAAIFSNNGQYLATGSVDGIIEIYDPLTCKIST